MKLRIALISTITALAAFATTSVDATDADAKNSKEEFKSAVKATGKGIKDSAVDVGHQIATGSKKAYHGAKGKIQKDVKDGKPGDGSLTKKSEAMPVVTESRK